MHHMADSYDLTRYQAAELADVHPGTIDRWFATGRISALWVKGKRYFSRSELEQIAGGIVERRAPKAVS